MPVAERRVLVLEDEPDLIDVLGTYLRDAGFGVGEDVVSAASLARAVAERPSAVVLDLHEPKLFGAEIFHRLRAVSDVPVLVLTSWVTEAERRSNLDLHADASVRKPFSPREVVARLEGLLGRDFVTPALRVGRFDSVQRIGEIEIDRRAHEVRRRGRAVALTPTEFRILDTLAAHLGQVLTREQLIERTVPDSDIFDRTLDRHVGNLRGKIEDDPPNPTCILTVFTVGYKMVARP